MFIARVKPEIELVNEKSAWEFYGHGKWNRGDVHSAEPIISWGNRTGVTTMPFNHAFKALFHYLGPTSQR